MKLSGRNYLLLMTLLLVALGIGGCSNQKEKGTKAAAGSSTAVTDQGPQSGTITGGNASDVNSRDYQGVNNNPNDTTDISPAGLNDPNNLLSQRIIYFDYDKAAIRPEYQVLINTHAKLLAKYPELRMRLEGHADERGTREYNVALSEERAQSVKKLMQIHGAKSTQIRTIGYGEEVPIVAGHGERSWQKNRRVEIKYDNY